MAKQRVMLSWSSGKDSAWALHKLQQSCEHAIVGIFTTVNAAFQRVAMHGVRVELLKRQAEAMGLPLTVIEIPYPCSNVEYERAIMGFIEDIVQQGIDGLVFGDLFLEDIRCYREKQLAYTELSLLFPLWGMPTDTLANTMIECGLKAMIACVDPKQCPKKFAGHEFNAEFLAALPDGIDHCGENGEFHTFVYDGPMFNYPIDISIGEVVERDGFVFADILLAEKT